MALDLNLVAPSRVGRFELKRVLGRGAQATVWLAWDSRLDRDVAVKLMPAPPGSDALSVNQWLQEARSVSRLTHPNIVPVFEADVHELQPYLVFEYVAGPTLSERMRARGPLPAHEAATLMLRALPRGTFPDPGVLTDGAVWLSSHQAYAHPGQHWGAQSLKIWTDYPAFLLKAGAIQTASGKPVASLNYSRLFTNRLLP